MQFSLQTLLLVFVVAWSSLAVFGMGGGIIAFVVTVWLAICVHRSRSLRWLLNLALLLLCLMCLIALLLPAVYTSGECTRCGQCSNQLKQLALAIHCYRDQYHCFPSAYIADKNGKPMHSWRVLILPDLECNSLYKQYDFTEPWSGPNNKKLLAPRPYGYSCPSDAKASQPSATTTNYVAVVGKNAAWSGDTPMRFDELAGCGEAANTVMLIEVANSDIQWTEPRDLSLEVLANAATLPNTIASAGHERHRNGSYIFDFFFHDSVVTGVNVAMADGSVHFLPTANLTPKGLCDLLQVGGYKDHNNGNSWSGGPQRLHWTNITALAIWLASVGLLFHRAVRSRQALLK